MPKVAVVLGAGASYDICEDESSPVIDNPSYRPPLISNLFKSPVFFEVGKLHAVASSLMSTVQNNMVRKGETLEEALADLDASENDILRWRLRFIPIFLHELFQRISNAYISEPVNYSILLDAIVNRNLQAAFITTNYDLLLEQALERFPDSSLSRRVSFTSIDSYIENPNWLVAKMHGSVGWGYKWPLPERVTSMLMAAERFELPPFNREDIVTNLPDDHFQDNLLHYPALALPVANKSTLVCPEAHLEKLKEFLKDCYSYLFIGFSAQDNDVLEFLAASIPDGSRAAIVTKGDLSMVIRRITEAVRQVSHDAAGFFQMSPDQKLGLESDLQYRLRLSSDDGFSSYVKSGALHNYLASIDK